jgi:hypothetical protein
VTVKKRVRCNLVPHIAGPGREEGKIGEVQIVDGETVKIGDASFKFDSRHVWA